MPRPTKHTAEAMLDAAAALLAEGGATAVTIPAVSAATGAPNGSIYHRFGSRDALLAVLWVRTVRAFQAGYLAALADDDLDRAAIDAATHVVTWSQHHVPEASLLLLNRRSQLAAEFPAELGSEVADLDRSVAEALEDHARRRGATLDRTTFALVDVPYAACRRALADGRAPSAEAVDLVAETVAHLLDIRIP